jgi:ribosomal protein S18 acetylase RimI-like enzyme
MKEDVFIRIATVADISDVINLGNAVLPAVYIPLTSEQYVQELMHAYWTSTAFANAIQASDTFLLVAILQEQVVGIAEVQCNGEKAVLWKLYVQADLRGTGIGKALIYEALRHLPEEIKWFYTEYLTSNTSAGEFYASQGFQFDHLEQDESNSNLSYTWVKQDVVNHPARRERLVRI